ASARRRGSSPPRAGSAPATWRPPAPAPRPWSRARPGTPARTWKPPVRILDCPPWQPAGWLTHSPRCAFSLLVQGVVLAFARSAGGLVPPVHPHVAGGRVVDHRVEPRPVVLPRIAPAERLVAEHGDRVPR